MSAGEADRVLVLRKSVGPWSAGTRVRLLERQGDELLVEPEVAPGETVRVPVGRVVALRARRFVPAPERGPQPEPEPEHEQHAERRRRMPFVVVSRTALEQWAALGDDRAVENVVAESILAGRVHGDRRLGPAGAVVPLDDGDLAAIVRRDARSPLGTRRAWRVVAIGRPNGEHEQGRGALRESPPAGVGRHGSAGSPAASGPTAAAASVRVPASPAPPGRHEPRVGEEVTPYGGI